MSGQSIVFFDGVCNLCNSSVQTILKYDRNGHFMFAPLQGETAKIKIAEYVNNHPGIDSIILVQDEKIYVKSTAVLRIARYLRFPLNLAFTFIIVPAFIRNVLYDWVAANRYKWYGKQNECWLPTPELKAKFLP